MNNVRVIFRKDPGTGRKSIELSVADKADLPPDTDTEKYRNFADDALGQARMMASIGMFLDLAP